MNKISNIIVDVEIILTKCEYPIKDWYCSKTACQTWNFHWSRGLIVSWCPKLCQLLVFDSILVWIQYECEYCMTKVFFLFQIFVWRGGRRRSQKKIAKKENERKDFNGISWCCSLVWPCTISAPSGHWWATYTECYTAGKHLKMQLDVVYD